MRFVVVTDKLAARVAREVDATGARDVAVLRAGSGEREPAEGVRRTLEAAPGSLVLAIQLDRKYVRALEALARVESQKQLSEQRLREWIVGQSEIRSAPVPAPSAAFQRAVAGEGRLVLAKGALDRVDDVPQHRHTFMAHAARALAELAGHDRTLGKSREQWFQERGHLDYAQSGNVRHRFHASCRLPDGGVPEQRDRWSWRQAA